MEKAIELSALTAEQRAELKAALKAEEAAAAKKRQEDKEAYIELVDETIGKCYGDLLNISRMLQAAKQSVFEEFKGVLALKEQLYGVRDRQASHQFTTSDGKITLSIGSRQIDAYDVTLSSGIAKVREYISSLAKDEASAKLVDIINSLLRMDKNGNLKPSRVIELAKMAAKIDDIGFKEGVAIIQQAYQPKKSSTFVSVCLNTENGKEWLPLSMSSAESMSKEDKYEQFNKLQRQAE